MLFGPFSGLGLIPFPVIRTCADDIAVDPPGLYCTFTVQLPPPGLRTVPEAQVPPAITEKLVAAGPEALMTVGAAVKVNAPALAPVAVLVIVTNPLLVLVFAGVVVRFRAENEIVAPVTVNGRLPVFPPGTTTVTLWLPRPAPLAMVNVAVIVESLTTVKPLTVMPPTLMPVAALRFVPVSVTGTDDPRTPLLGLICVSTGATTVKVTGLLVPPEVVTVTFLAVRAAPPAIVNVAVTVVSLTTAMLLTEMPADGVTVTAVVPVKAVPVRVTGTTLPRV